MLNKVVKIALATIAVAQLLSWIAKNVDSGDCLFLWFSATTIIFGMHIASRSINEDNELQYKHEIEMCSKAKKKLELLLLKKRRMSSKT